MHLSLIRVFGYFVGGLWTAWGGRRRIEAKQLARLRRLVKKARQASPFFHELYSQLPDSSRLELRDLPVTYKPDLMANFDRWLTVGDLTLAQAREHMSDLMKLGVPLRQYATFRTSGTSGEPAVVILPVSFLECLVGIFISRLSKRQLMLAKKIRKTGRTIIITGGNGHFAGIGINRLLRNLFPRLVGAVTFIPAELSIEKIVQKLNEIPKIASIVTYPSTLAILTAEQEAHRLKIKPAIFKVGGETFTQELRLRVRRAFPTIVHDTLEAYACTECLNLAIECEYGRQHVCEDWVILEAVDENRRPVSDGTLSDSALLTVLANEVQPFIRYDIGDRLRFYTDTCPCGSPFRCFQVEGRQATLIHVGKVTLSPLAFDLEHESALRTQLVQLKEKVFEVRAELPKSVGSDPVFKQIIHAVKQVFAENGLLDVEVRASTTPPQLTASGKFHEILPLKKVNLR